MTDAKGLTVRTYKDAQGRGVRVAKDNGTPGNASDDVTTRTIYGIAGEAIATSVVPAPVGATSADDFPTGTIGREVIQLDELDRATYQLYDKLGRLTDVWLAAVDDASVAGTDMVNPHWQYSYRSDGVQLSQQDPMGRITSFEYDNVGNRTARSLPDGAAERWSYDEFGRTLTHVDFKGQITRYVYDDNVSLPSGENTNLGRLVEERRFGSSDSYNDGKGTPQERTHYLYDELGRQSEVTEYVGSGPTLSTSYEYDPIGGQVTRVGTSASGTIHHEFDPATGRLTRTWTDNNETNYHYNDLGQLDTVTAVKLNGSTVNLVTSHSYDEVGNLDTTTQPNGVVTTYTYDGLNRLDMEVVTNSGGHKLFEQDYTLLEDGQRDYDIGGQMYNPMMQHYTPLAWERPVVRASRVVAISALVNRNRTTPH